MLKTARKFWSWLRSWGQKQEIKPDIVGVVVEKYERENLLIKSLTLLNDGGVLLERQEIEDVVVLVFALPAGQLGMAMERVSALKDEMQQGSDRVGLVIRALTQPPVLPQQ